MIDLPPEQFQAPKTEIEQIVAEATVDFSTPSVASVEDEAFTQAKTIVETFKDGFQWSDIGTIMRLSFDFIKDSQGLTIDEQKAKVVAILNHVIDLTDTPYLPDDYTDPLFKSMIPPLIDIVAKANGGQFQLIPAISGEQPSAETFQNFIRKTKETFSDGFQWQDLAAVIRHTIEFVSGFPGLSLTEQKNSITDIVFGIIDATDTPYLPDSFVDPVFKSIVGPVVDVIFEKLGY